MNEQVWLLDWVLVITLVLLAWKMLSITDLFKVIVLFIAFGLLMALTWVRLKAIDIALAEAAIGAGLTGALFLTTLSHLGSSTDSGDQPGNTLTQEPPDDEARYKSSLSFSHSRLLVLLLTMALSLALGFTVFALPPAPSRLVDAIHSNMPQTGVVNPITAVLLNFRGYDTFLEIGVLLVAVLGVKALPDPHHIRSFAIPAAGPILQALVRLVVPLMVLIAGYFLWAGSHAPGGAFQGGAILAAAAVLALLAGLPLSGWFQGTWFRVALIFGFGLFLGVGIWGIAIGGHFLEYPRDQAGALILLIEAALTVSIGLILATLFLGNPDFWPASNPAKKDP